MPPIDFDSIRLRRLGAVLRKARENLRYSYRELAALSGVSASQIMRIESGEFEFSLTKFLRVAECLGLCVGLVLDSTSHRTQPRHKIIENLHRSQKQMDADLDGFIPQSDPKREMKKEDIECQVAWLVYTLAEGVSSLVLSSNPIALSFYMYHPFEPIVEALHTFANGWHDCSFHQERAVFIESLTRDPYGKLKQIGVLNKKLIDEFLAWEKRKGKFSCPGIASTWASSHVHNADEIPKIRKKS